MHSTARTSTKLADIPPNRGRGRESLRCFTFHSRKQGRSNEKLGTAIAALNYQKKRIERLHRAKAGGA